MGVGKKHPDIIDMSFDGRIDGREGSGFGRAVSFNYVLNTGKIPSALRDDPTTSSDDVQYIDFASDDLYTRALAKVETSATDRIMSDPELTALREKPEWTKEDCMNWERKVSKIVSQELDAIPGLDKYRVEKVDDVRRVTRLNDVSEDMANGTRKIEFDCESMSAFEGVVLQRINNKMLPPASDSVGYKQAGQYYFVQGRADTNIHALGKSAGHAFIVSSLTGSIIDATIQGDNSPYFTPQEPDFGLEDLSQSRASLYTNGDVGVIYSSNGTYDITAYKLRNGMVPGMEGFRTPEELLFANVGTSAEFRAKKLWPENLHLSELKENIQAQRTLLEKDAPGSEAYKERVETLTLLEDDFKNTVRATAFRSSDSVVIANDAFIQYNREIMGITTPSSSAPPAPQSGALPQLGSVNKQISSNPAGM